MFSADPAVRTTWRSCAVDEPVIALTFDDGPSARLTPRLLEVLKSRDVRATLFVIGRHVAAHPDLLRRAVAEGHEAGNHSWSHPHLTRISREEAEEEIRKTSEAIAEATGRKPALFRPPFFSSNPGLEKWIWAKFGLGSILADVDSLDWRDKDPVKIREQVLSKVVPGSIILMHENQPATLDGLGGIIDALKERGFRFVTVSELIAMEAAAAEKGAGPAVAR